MSNYVVSEDDQKKVVSFLNFLFYDIYQDKVSFPYFADSIGVLNQNTKYNLVTVFKDLCGRNRKYITVPRFYEAFVAYKVNSDAISLETKNFLGWVFNELLHKNDQKIGKVIKDMKEFSSKHMVRRTAITNIQVHTCPDNDIVGMSVVWDDKNKVEYMAPANKEEGYITKIDLNLKINHDFCDQDEEAEEDPEELEFCRDFVTHVFGSHTETIESIGFKTAYGKLYYTGRPTIGEPFLIGSPGLKFHYFKIGMHHHLNTAEFKFKEALSNPSLQVRYEDITRDQFNQVFEDEKFLKNLPDGPEKDKYIFTPLNDEAEFFHSDSDDCSGDSYEHICNCASDEECHSDEEEDDPEIKALIEESKKKQKKKLELLEREQVKKQEEEKREEDLFKKRRKNTPWTKVYAADINMYEVINDPDNIDTFLDKFSREIKEELDEQVWIQRKVNFMKEDYYYQYFNMYKRQKDWDLLVLDTAFDPFELEKAFFEVKSSWGIDDYKDYDIPLELYLATEEEAHDHSDKEVKNNFRMMARFLKRKVARVFIKEILCTKAKDIMVDYEAGRSSVDLKYKIRLLKMLSSLKNEKQIINNLRLETAEKERIKKVKQRDHQKKKLKDKTIAQHKKEIKRNIKKEKPYTDEDVARILKKDIKEIRQNFKAEAAAAKDRLNRFNRNILQGHLPLDDEEVVRKYTRAKKLNVWFKENAKKQIFNDITQKAKVDPKKSMEEILKKRKRIMHEQKEALLRKKREELEEEAKLMKDPVKTSEIIKNDDTMVIYRDQKLPKSGEKFKDTIFPPTIDSLCPFDKSRGTWIYPEGVLPDDVIDWETFQWTDIPTVMRTDNFQVFFSGIEADDIIQGSLGDCYFLSAIAALTKYPELIKKLFLFDSKSEEGCYGIRYRVNGIWEVILLDDKIPGDGNSRPRLVFSETNGHELWVILLEKAWAKLCGNYAKAVAGLPSEVFDCICNSYSENTNITQDSSELLWQKIKDAKKNNFIMTAGTGGSPNLDYEGVNLVMGHAYTVLDSEEFFHNGVQVRLVKIRNPWGSSEWSGDWSDDSFCWTDELRQKLNLSEKDDGVFYMSLDDFVTYYVIFSVCKIYPSYEYNSLQFKAEEVDTPKVLEIQVEQASNTFIQIFQKNPRFISHHGTYPENSFAFIMLLDENFNYMKSVCSEGHVNTIEIELTRGTYYLVSDVSYRYINRKEPHGYTVGVTSKVKTQFLKPDLDYLEVLNKGIISYALKNLTPSNEGGVKVYEPSSYMYCMPYIPCVIENTTSRTVTGSVNLQRNCLGSSGFVPDSQITTLEKKIEPRTTEAFIIRKFFVNSSPGYSRSIQ